MMALNNMMSYSSLCLCLLVVIYYQPINGDELEDTDSVVKNVIFYPQSRTEKEPVLENLLVMKDRHDNVPKERSPKKLASTPELYLDDANEKSEDSDEKLSRKISELRKAESFFVQQLRTLLQDTEKPKANNDVPTVKLVVPESLHKTRSSDTTFDDSPSSDNSEVPNVSVKVLGPDNLRKAVVDRLRKLIQEEEKSKRNNEVSPKNREDHHYESPVSDSSPLLFIVPNHKENSKLRSYKLHPTRKHKTPSNKLRSRFNYDMSPSDLFDNAADEQLQLSIWPSLLNSNM